MKTPMNKHVSIKMPLRVFLKLQPRAVNFFHLPLLMFSSSDDYMISFTDGKVSIYRRDENK